MRGGKLAVGSVEEYLAGTNQGTLILGTRNPVSNDSLVLEPNQEATVPPICMSRDVLSADVTIRGPYGH